MGRNFFASIHNKTTCRLCGYQPSVVKKYILHRHYNMKHSKNYSIYVNKEKTNIIEELKLTYQEDCSSNSQSL